MIKILDFMGLFLYCLFIYWLSDQSSLPIPHVFSMQDKILHAGAYFIMGILAWRGFSHLFNRPVTLALFGLAFCSLYGISDEWHQSFIEGRFSDITDWIADTGGAGLAVFLLTRRGDGLHRFTANVR
jgi:VanZ family protein